MKTLKMVWCSCLVLFLSIYKALAEELPLESFSPASNCSEQNFGSSEENYAQVPVAFPTTSFTCWGRYDGYYADVEVDCTIFHYCQTWNFPSGRNETVKWDFVCPHNTIFNQKLLSCIPPSNSFECQDSPNYYWVNKNLYSPNVGIAVNAASDSSYYASQQLVDCPCGNAELKPSHHDSQPSSQNEYGNYANSVPPYPTYSEFHGLPQKPSDVDYSQFYPTENTQPTEYYDSHGLNKGYDLNVANPASLGNYNLETSQSYQVNNIPVNDIPVNYIEFSTPTIPVSHDSTTLHSKSFNNSVKNLEVPQSEKLNVSTLKNQGNHIYGFFKQQPSTSEFNYNKLHNSDLKNIALSEDSDALKSHFSDSWFPQNLPDSGEQVIGQTFLSSSNDDQFTVQSVEQNSTKNFGDQQYAGAIFSSENSQLHFASTPNFTESSVVEFAETRELPEQYTFNLNSSYDVEQNFNLTEMNSNATTFEFSEPNTAQPEDLRIFSGNQVPDLNQSFVPSRQNLQTTPPSNPNEPFVTFPLDILTFPDETNKASDETNQFFLQEHNDDTPISKNASHSLNVNDPVVSSLQSFKNGNFHSQPNLTDLDDNNYEGSGEPSESNVKDDDIEELVSQDNRQSRTRYFLVN